MSKNVLEPVGPRILVRRKEKTEEVSEGGIIIPESARSEKVYTSTVVSVGDGYRNPEGEVIPLSIKVGDVIITNKMAGTEVRFEGDTFYLVMEEEVLARVSQKES